jgi:hypothetical protein
MSIHVFEDVFSQENLVLFNNSFELSKKTFEDPTLGRIRIIPNNLPQNIESEVIEIVNSLFDEPMTFTGYSLVEYNSKYGNPNLPVHFDGDNTDFIFNFQLSSNTSWGIGVNLDTYQLKDNSAVTFHPNLDAHWRPIKTFEPGEYVRMIFFRFYKTNNKTDYSHLNYHPNNKLFKDINALRGYTPDTSVTHGLMSIPE